MKKKDFTSEFVGDALVGHFLNQFPHDELDDIGSRVAITDICDVELNSVERSGSNFIVDGTATVETETDLGEGDAWNDSYPMSFSYEFDEDGRIERERNRHIDTSSFFGNPEEFDELLIQSISTDNRGVFQRSIRELLNLLEGQSLAHHALLRRLLYVNVITALESYLSDFFISRVKADRKLLRKCVESNEEFRKEKFTVSQVFEVTESIEQKLDKYLLDFVWHRFHSVKTMFKDVFGVNFPSEIAWLFKAVLVRHDIVHRNGKGKDGTERDITKDAVRNLAKLAQGLVDHIENEWFKLSPPPV